MNSVDGLISKIRSAPWFSMLGTSQGSAQVISLAYLVFWEYQDSSSGDLEIDALLGKMNWLPTTRDQPDPFDSVLDLSAEVRRPGLLAYKAALEGINNSLPNGRLRCGPHDFSDAARSAGAFAARSTVRCLAAHKNTRWTEVIGFYLKGHWPLGLLPDGRLVVY